MNQETIIAAARELLTREGVHPVPRGQVHGPRLRSGRTHGSDEEVEAIDSLAAVERRHILTVLDACDGNRAEAARRLGVSRKTIDRKCAGWGL